MNDTTMMIAIEEAKIAAQRANGDIVDRLRAAMVEVKDHWLVTRDVDRFKAAVGGTMLFYGENTPEYDRLRREFEIVAKFSNAVEGGEVLDLAAIVSEFANMGYEAVGLLKIWQKVAKVTPNG